MTKINSTPINATQIAPTKILSASDSKDISQSSMKEYINQFSCYDIVDTAYDLFYQIPDVADIFMVGMGNFESGCDKYDYALAAFAGGLSGLIDVFFVGIPGDSLLGDFADSFIDDRVIKFAQMIFDIDAKSNKKSQKKRPESISSAIGYLERRFKINYDARFPTDLIGGEILNNFNPSSHHLKSLAHSPDVVGLFFSILDQFTNKTSIVNNGKLFRLESVNENVELRGNNFITKIICGIINWIGHLISDVAGSSGTRGHDNSRGMGIPIPGFELFQFLGADGNKEMKGLAELTEKMFLKGYDMRFGIAMEIPVIVNNMIVKIFWALRERFQYRESWKNILVRQNDDRRLVRMTFVSSGCFSLVDVGDALLRSEGNILLFSLRINYVGICKFAFAGYREVAVRVKDVKEEDVELILENEWGKIFQEK